MIAEKFPKRCQRCRYKRFSITLGSKDKPIWHCRYGFSPSGSCLHLAEYNDNCFLAMARNENSSIDSLSVGTGIQLFFDYEN